MRARVTGAGERSQGLPVKGLRPQALVVKHLTMAEKSLLIGDRAGDLLLSYAAFIAQVGRGDHVTLRAIGIDGVEVEAGILLNSGTVLVVESSTSILPEPDNAAAIDYMETKLDLFGLDGADTPHPFVTTDAPPSDASATDVPEA